MKNHYRNIEFMSRGYWRSKSGMAVVGAGTSWFVYDAAGVSMGPFNRLANAAKFLRDTVLMEA